MTDVDLEIKKDKKRKMILYITLLVIVVLLYAFIIWFKPIYFQNIYSGHRLTQSVTVKIDGKKAKAEKSTIKCDVNDIASTVKSKVGTTTTNIYSDESKAGKYTFYLTAKPKKSTKTANLKISVEHSNWWSVDNSSVTANINSKKHTASCKYDFTYINKFGNKKITHGSKKVKLNSDGVYTLEIKEK